jgi:signal transduction histidine kinase/CheY-like chemotaxis protein
MKPQSIRTQVAMLALLPATFIALALATYFTYTRFQDAERTLVQHGEALTRHLAAAAEFPMVTGNASLLQRQVLAVSKQSSIEFAQIRDGQGRRLVSMGRSPEDAEIAAVLGKEWARSERRLVFTLPIWLQPAEIDDLYLAEDARQPPQRLGFAVLGISLEALEKQRQQTLLGGLLMTLLILLVTYVFAFGLGERLSAPLHALARTVAELGRGHLGARASTDAHGELLQLQEGVNEMASSLQQARDGLQRRIQEATADLYAQKEAAESANADKSRFLAATSHDLRQPMHALGLFAAALREKLDTPEQIALVRKIEESVLALEGMFNVLLDVSKLESGVLSVHAQTFRLRPMLARLDQEWAGAAEEKGLRLRTRRSGLAVRSDAILLNRILNNLVKNAIRYTRAGGVLVGARRRGDHVSIEVWDTGIGIAPQHLQHIFEEFYQVDNPERNRARGLGLGLYIVQRLCQLLGHRVEVHSRPGRGSVFRILLPRAESVPDPGGENEPATRFGREWVLLLEDDEDVLSGMRVLLEGWGLRVQAATNLDAAMLAPLEPGGPALVLCDYRLGGGLTGAAAIARLRQLHGSALPAILISGDTSQEGVAEMQASGLPILHKPVRPAKLRSLLNHLLPRGDFSGLDGSGISHPPS